jgi:hypothetical protein
MRHDERRDVLEIAQLDDLVVHGRGDDRIEAGRRVVEQQERRSRGNCPGNTDAAPLTAGQGRGHRVDQGSKSDEAQHLFDPRTNGRPWHVGLLVEPVADVLVDGQRIEEGVLLEQHADVGAHSQQIALCQGVDALAMDVNGTGIRAKQPENQLEQDGFARAAVAEQDPRGATGDLEAHVAQNHVLVERERDPVEHHRRRDLGLADDTDACRLTCGTVRCGDRDSDEHGHTLDEDNGLAVKRQHRAAPFADDMVRRRSEDQQACRAPATHAEHDQLGGKLLRQSQKLPMWRAFAYQFGDAAGRAHPVGNHLVQTARGLFDPGVKIDRGRRREIRVGRMDVDDVNHREGRRVLPRQRHRIVEGDL